MGNVNRDVGQILNAVWCTAVLAAVLGVLTAARRAAEMWAVAAAITAVFAAVAWVWTTANGVRDRAQTTFLAAGAMSTGLAVSIMATKGHVTVLVVLLSVAAFVNLGRFVLFQFGSRSRSGH